jgi:purine-nucleoside phosphorylase
MLTADFIIISLKERGLTMNLIDEYKGVLPSSCLITDDPYRVKMIAAHYLDRVQIFTETRGQVGLIGEFSNIPLTVLSVGIGKNSTMAYLTELCSKNQINRIVYFGDCITEDPSIPVGSITYISKAYENEKYFTVSESLFRNAEIIMKQNSIKALPCATTTNDNYFIEKKYILQQESKVLDFTTSAIYKFNRTDTHRETLSILNVCENVVTNERIEEAVRQSGCHSAIMLALNTLIFKVV